MVSPRKSCKPTIFIPTRGRHHKQTTRNKFRLDELGYEVIYVIPESEISKWRTEDIEIDVVPDKYKFSDIRQYIATTINPGLHIIIDDDLYPAVRVDGVKLSRTSIFDSQKELDYITNIFEDIVDLYRKGYYHGGLSPRQGNNVVEEDYQYCTREMRFHFYDTDLITKTGFDFRDVIVRQDFHFTLTMLQYGLPNVVIYHTCQDQVDSNTEGGCSNYRTKELLHDQAFVLQSLHPEFVKVVEKETKVYWGGGKRTDVRVSWKKAYKKGKRYVENLRKLNPKTLDNKDRAILRMQPKL